ncbi:MAG TPA: hypothetical protein VGJ84_06740, partial [Polyangiaceae bacterium]
MGVGLAGLCAALWFISCKQKPPPGAAADGKSLVGIGASVQRPQPGAPQLPPELASAAAADASTPKQPASFQWAGPWLVVTDAAAAAYAEPSSEKKQKIGWLRNGGRVPVESEPALRGGDCKHGWYKIVNAGYLCGDAGTTDANNPKVRIALRAPNLEEVLPYQYARNAKHGTPLYRSVPSREQMLEYEPYLKPKPKQEPNLAEPVDGGAPNALGAPPLPLDAGVQSDAQVQWWQRDNVKEFLHELTKEKLEEGADDILIKRMVAGFYVAIDRTFRWDGRTWYKTTQRLVAPADRFWLTPGPK